ncbi:MAG: hypothetical protein II889_04135 [Clostridia bacterium]|nr:hypothetical protein [Clostridia bacterium]
MKKWRRIRLSLLFWLSAAFAVLFAAGLLAVIFTDAEAASCVVPPYLGFCFTYPLWRRNRKQAAEGDGK